MKIFAKNILLPAMVFSAVFPFLLQSARAQEPCRSERGGHCVSLQSTEFAQAYRGLEFLGLTADSTVGDIFSKLYAFGVGLIGVSALIMITFGGIMYLSAGDSQHLVGQGRTYIKNALFGLVLALLSYVILYTINPDLVKDLDLTSSICPLDPAAPLPAGCPPI